MQPIILGVAGGSGSGKTTVVRAIVNALGPDHVTVIHHDAYYRDTSHFPPDARAAINYDHPDALETSLLVAHLDALGAGHDVQVPVYDFTAHARRPESVLARARRIVIVDGLLVLWDRDLRERMGIKVYVDTDPDVRFIRRLERDMGERGRSAQSVIRQYLDTVRPMHLEFVEPSKRWADLIIPEGGHNVVAIDMLVTKIRAVLGREPDRRTARRNAAAASETER